MLSCTARCPLPCRRRFFRRSTPSPEPAPPSTARARKPRCISRFRRPTTMWSTKMQTPSRRQFLALGGRSLAAIGAASLAGRLSQVSGMAQSACPSDYKALVCVFLFGGNDCNNTLIPISTPSSNPNNSYAKYAAVPAGLALPRAGLNSINTSKGDEYALHPGLAELATLYNTKKNVVVLANVGSLVTPLTRPDYLQQSKTIPLNLLLHLYQQ